ncbi:MAG: 2-isopropylmalate synthase, partial [Paenibacillus sp.]|nr:2-isopropylmalate synthase [Paenibacillus sp.]
RMGFETSGNEDFEKLFERFLALADSKKEVYDHDVFYLVTNHRTVENTSVMLYELVSFQVISNDLHPTASVTLKKGEDTFQDSAVGDGPIDALYTVIKNMVGLDVQLKDYKITSLSRGKDAIGRVNIRMEYEGKAYAGRAMDTDIIKASAHAFLNAINAALLEAEQEKQEMAAT